MKFLKLLLIKIINVDWFISCCLDILLFYINLLFLDFWCFFVGIDIEFEYVLDKIFGKELMEYYW